MTASKQASAEVRAEMARQSRTMSSLAIYLGISQPTALRRLKGQIPFSLDELARVAAWLDVPITAFIVTEAVAS